MGSSSLAVDPMGLREQKNGSNALRIESQSEFLEEVLGPSRATAGDQEENSVWESFTASLEVDCGLIPNLDQQGQDYPLTALQKPHNGLSA